MSFLKKLQAVKPKVPKDRVEKDATLGNILYQMIF